MIFGGERWLTLCYNELGRDWVAPGGLTVFSPIFKTDNKTATNVKLAKITTLAQSLDEKTIVLVSDDNYRC